MEISPFCCHKRHFTDTSEHLSQVLALSYEVVLFLPPNTWTIQQRVTFQQGASRRLFLSSVKLTCTRRRNNGHNTGSLNPKHKIKPSSIQQAGTFLDFHPNIKSNPYYYGKCISLQLGQSVRDYTWRFIRYIPNYWLYLIN